MSLTSDEIAALHAKAAEADALRERLALVDGKKGEILDEKKQLQTQLQELRDNEEARKKKELEHEGRTAELLAQERKEKEDLRKQIEEKDQAIAKAEEKRTQDRLRADFLGVFNASEVFQPDHAWELLHSFVSDDDGKTVATVGGQKGAIADLAGRLRKDTQYAYLFKPKGGGGGMGSRPAAGDSIDLSRNPYLPGGNVTMRLDLETSNPDLAAKLKAEAATAANSKG
jgi:hypothetical protein